ncbi:MAG TPA: DinB family protein [Pyrinomonadaceae bacterium]|jgi:uncharacterized damage-inducible protein DinB
MFRKIEDFQKAWGYEAESTIKLFNHLTDESLNQKVTEDGRSIGFLAWHLVTTLGEMLGHAGLKIDVPSYETAAPETVSEIISAFETGAKSVGEEVAKNWTDETLMQEDNLYGETWRRGETLGYLLVHQTHHRGQITVLMRQAGLPVAGVYGPAKEEWQALGMPAMA